MRPCSLLQNAPPAPRDAVFGTGGMTAGLITPPEASAHSPIPTPEGQAVNAGFASLSRGAAENIIDEISVHILPALARTSRKGIGN